MSGRQAEGTFALKLDTCIICSYYNMRQERGARKTQSRFFLFGQYLSSKNLITCDDVIRARALQLRNNQKIGVLAVHKGMLTDDQVQKILIIQEETLKKFGEIATDLGFLTEAQVKELVLEQEDIYLFFGEALVQLGVLTEATMLLHLKDFNSLKLRRRLEGLSGSR